MTAPSIDALLASTDLSTLASDPSISEFWRKQIAKARASAEAANPGRPLRLADVVACLGYAFRRRPEGTSAETDPDLVAVLETFRNHSLPLAKKAGPAGCGLTSDQWEHLTAVGYLQLQGMLDAYLAFITPLGVRSDMSSARHFYYSTVISRLWENHLRPDLLHVLEIGAGAGNLAVFLMKRGLVATYTVVDLPEMLLNAALQLREYCPEARLHYHEAPGPVEHTGPHVYLLPTLDVAGIPANRFTMALNFNSFMEMDKQARDRYISEIYRTLRHGGVFYNVNRRQAALPQPDGSTFDNNPLLYPYRTSDRILFWEEDPFQTATRSWFLFRPSLAVARAAVVHKPG